jgi:hypothetical protein
VEPSARGAPGVKAGLSGGGKLPMATGSAVVPGEPLTAAPVMTATAASSVSVSAVGRRHPRCDERDDLNP